MWEPRSGTGAAIPRCLQRFVSLVCPVSCVHTLKDNTRTQPMIVSSPSLGPTIGASLQCLHPRKLARQHKITPATHSCHVCAAACYCSPHALPADQSLDEATWQAASKNLLP